MTLEYGRPVQISGASLRPGFTSFFPTLSLPKLQYRSSVRSPAFNIGVLPGSAEGLLISNLGTWVLLNF